MIINIMTLKIKVRNSLKLLYSSEQSPNPCSSPKACPRFGLYQCPNPCPSPRLQKIVCQSPCPNPCQKSQKISCPSPSLLRTRTRTQAHARTHDRDRPTLNLSLNFVLTHQLFGNTDSPFSQKNLAFIFLIKIFLVVWETLVSTCATNNVLFNAWNDRY